MDLKKAKFEAGTSGYIGLNGAYYAYAHSDELADLYICCAAKDETTALTLRQHVLSRLHPEFDSLIAALMPVADGNLPEFQAEVDEHNYAVNRLRSLYRHDIPHARVYHLTAAYQAAVAKADSLQAEIDQLRQRLHDHDRRRDASMELARTLAEGVDAVPSFDWKDAPDWAAALVCNVTNELFLWVEKYSHRNEGHEGKIKCQVATGRYPIDYVFMEQSHGWQLVSTRPTPNHVLIADDLRKLADDLEPAGCRECFGFEHLDCICHDSGNAPA